MIKRGTLAYSIRGALGVVLVDEPVSVAYEDGSTGMEWAGVHLTSFYAKPGAAWSSRTPYVIGQIDSVYVSSFLSTIGLEEPEL